MLLDTQKRDAENRAQVAVISRRLTSSTMVRKELQIPAGFELVQPDRQLVKEGSLDDVRGTSSQTYGSILTDILHINGVPCCCIQARGCHPAAGS